MTNAVRDNNSIPVALGMLNTDGKTIGMIGVDPTSHITQVEDLTDILSEYPDRFLITPSSINSDLYYDLSLAPASFWSNVRSDGGDIRVTAQDGPTQLAREVSGFDYAGHKGLVYIGGLTGHTACYMYYGNPSATEPAANSAYGKYNTWESALFGVYLMNGNGNDATSKQNTANAIGSPTFSAGRLSGQQCLNCGDGSTNKYLQTASYAHGISVGDFTILAWANPNFLSVGSNCPIAAFGLYNPVLSSSDTRVSTGLCGYFVGFMNGGHSFPLNAWARVAMVRRSGFVYFYFNGVNTTPAGINKAGVDVGLSSILNIGTDNFAADKYGGLIGETRFYTRGLTDAELATDYANQNNPASFWTTGGAEIMIPQSNSWAERDDNVVPVLMGVSSSDGVTPVPLYVNSSKQLLIQST